jgi:hypothetical protein
MVLLGSAANIISALVCFTTGKTSIVVVDSAMNLAGKEFFGTG